MNRPSLLACVFAYSIISSASAADWPQFRGPQRDGVSRETGLLQEWPKGGPKLLFTFTQTGLGYAGPSIVGDRLYTAGGRGDAEYVFALDLKDAANGKVTELWATKIGPLFNWKGNSWNVGPNVAPTVDGDALFVLGGNGDLVCVATADGKERWRKNLPRELGGEVNPIGGGAEEPTPLGWGYAHAPLVDGDQVICVPGGKKGLLAALDKKTGKLLWQSKEVTDQAPYSSPMIVDVGGNKHYVQVTYSGIVGVSPKDGKLLWHYKRTAYEDVVISPPIVKGEYVYASVGFGEGCDLVKLGAKNSGVSAEKVYSTKELQNRDGGVVLVGDHLFGHSEKGGWVCQEFKTGKIVWSERELLTRGSVTAADGRLYCVAEKGGAVVLLEPTTKEWTEKGRFKLPKESSNRRPSGCLWTHPVIANGRLYIRDQEMIHCYDVKK